LLDSLLQEKNKNLSVKIGQIFKTGTCTQYLVFDF